MWQLLTYSDQAESPCTVMEGCQEGSYNTTTFCHLASDPKVVDCVPRPKFRRPKFTPTTWLPRHEFRLTVASSSTGPLGNATCVPRLATLYYRVRILVMPSGMSTAKPDQASRLRRLVFCLSCLDSPSPFLPHAGLLPTPRFQCYSCRDTGQVFSALSEQNRPG